MYYCTYNGCGLANIPTRHLPYPTLLLPALRVCMYHIYVEYCILILVYISPWSRKGREEKKKRRGEKSEGLYGSERQKKVSDMI